jgi:hypothetical protein
MSIVPGERAFEICHVENDCGGIVNFTPLSAETKGLSAAGPSCNPLLLESAIATPTPLYRQFIPTGLMEPFSTIAVL